MEKNSVIDVYDYIKKNHQILIGEVNRYVFLVLYNTAKKKFTLVKYLDNGGTRLPGSKPVVSVFYRVAVGLGLMGLAVDILSLKGENKSWDEFDEEYRREGGDKKVPFKDKKILLKLIKIIGDHLEYDSQMYHKYFNYVDQMTVTTQLETEFVNLKNTQTLMEEDYHDNGKKTGNGKLPYFFPVYSPLNDMKRRAIFVLINDPDTVRVKLGNGGYPIHPKYDWAIVEMDIKGFDTMTNVSAPKSQYLVRENISKVHKKYFD